MIRGSVRMDGCAVVSISKPCSCIIIRRTTPSFPNLHSYRQLFLPPRVCSISLVTNKPFICRLEKSRGFSAISSKCIAAGTSDYDFVVVNFYRFVFIENPEEEVAKHLSFLQGLDIHGRVYLNEQGINAQYSGPSKDALAYLEWLREDHRFSDTLVQVSPALFGHAFPKLKLRYKPSLVQLEGGFSHLSLLDPSTRATPLTPSEWRKRLEALNYNDAQNVNLNTNYVLLDVRNGYEWDIGHFRGAQRPDVDCFRSTSFGLTQSEVITSDPLAHVDKENTDILMYCTGGIRCDVYSAILRESGFQKLYTLQGGVSHYLEKEGPVEWVGNLFVFDSRLSLPPCAYKPEATGEPPQQESRTFARCYICDSGVCESRHRNCANLDCNLLFLKIKLTGVVLSITVDCN